MAEEYDEQDVKLLLENIYLDEDIEISNELFSAGEDENVENDLIWEWCWEWFD